MWTSSSQLCNTLKFIQILGLFCKIMTKQTVYQGWDIGKQTSALDKLILDDKKCLAI